MFGIDTLLNKVLIGAVAVLLMTTAVQSWRVNNLKKDNAQLSLKLSIAKAEIKALNDVRAQELLQNQQGVEELTTFCRQQRDAAVRAGRAIERILKNDEASHPNSPDIVTADELRDLLSAKPAA